MRFIRGRATLTLVAWLGVGVACAEGEAEPVTSVEPTEPGDETGPDAVRSDAEVMEVMLVADDAEVEQGSLAQVRGQNAEVRAFADAMVQEHYAASQRLHEITTTTGVFPETSSVSITLQNQSNATLKTLQGIVGPPFDVAYVDAQIASHEEVLRLVDDILTPVVQEPQLAAELRSMRASLVVHLDEARRIRSTLGS